MRPAWFTSRSHPGASACSARILAGLHRDNTAAAARLVQSADDVALTGADIARVLPCPAEIADLLYLNSE